MLIRWNHLPLKSCIIRLLPWIPKPRKLCLYRMGQNHPRWRIFHHQRMVERRNHVYLQRKIPFSLVRTYVRYHLLDSRSLFTLLHDVRPLLHHEKRNDLPRSHLIINRSLHVHFLHLQLIRISFRLVLLLYLSNRSYVILNQKNLNLKMGNQ